MNIVVREIVDPVLISKDDGTIPFDQWQPNLAFVLFLECIVDDKPVGALLWHPHNSTTWQTHSALLPEVWGKGVSLDAFKAAMKYMKDRYGMRKTIATCPVTATHVMRFCKRLGMKQEGRIKWGIKINDEFVDLIQYGVFD